MKRNILNFAIAVLGALVMVLSMPISPASAAKPTTQLTIPTVCVSGSGAFDATPTLQLNAAADRGAIVGGSVVFTWWDTFSGSPAPNGVLDPQTVLVTKRVRLITGNAQGFATDPVIRRWVVATGYDSSGQQVFSFTSADLVYCT